MDEGVFLQGAHVGAGRTFRVRLRAAVEWGTSETQSALSAPRYRVRVVMMMQPDLLSAWLYGHGTRAAD